MSSKARLALAFLVLVTAIVATPVRADAAGPC